MHDFRENECRCCKKVFCCKKCRGNHENLEHGVFPDCDICLYGKAVLTNASDILLNHVKSVHWPLRCLFCKRFFGTTDELKRHNKCPVRLKSFEQVEKSPYTPGQSYNESTYDSPPLSLLLPMGQQPNKNLNMFSNLATSTPMQRNDENNLLEQIPEAITPVEHVETDNKDSESKTKLDSDALPKRKVTFCETPVAESCRTPKNPMKNISENSETDAVSNGGDSGNTSSGIFYSVKEESDSDLDEDDETKDIQQNKIPGLVIEEYDEKKTENKENVNIKHEDSTLWVSANNATSDTTEEKYDATDTPTASKQKMRQISFLVIPTPIVIKAEQSTQHEGKTRATEAKTRATERTLIDDNSSSDSSVDEPKSYEETVERNNIIRETVSEVILDAERQLWVAVSKFFSNSTNVTEGNPTTLKRRSTEHDSIDGPSAKRYKLTDIKCRPSIRDLPQTRTTIQEVQESSKNSYEIYGKNNLVDKATQTDDYLFEEAGKTN